ncbi:enterochelin esterase [Actinacidiphila sp. bgisy167]|uniref:enterochelin esterase n=1 Tax=Actinacidiphila sp. bgisy167 TaxID=3413797 RepID=UPI003D739B03
MLSPLGSPPNGTPSRAPRVPRPAPVERAHSRRLGELAARPEREAEFWAAVAAEGTPLVERLEGDPGHCAVTFLWRGTARTRAVLALPNQVLDPDDLAGNLMSRIPGTQVWHWTIRMRADWRATYALCVDEGDGAVASPTGTAGPAEATAITAPTQTYLRRLRRHPRRDPLNTQVFPTRWGVEPLSVVALPEAPVPRGAWRDRPGPPVGEVSVHTLRSAHLRNWRRVWCYAPAGHEDPAGLPVVVLLDGDVWQQHLDVSALLDGLVASGALPPLLALMPDALDSGTRRRELSCDERLVDFLTGELLPWAARRWPAGGDPARTVVAGQGLGGLASAYAALRRPESFGNVLAQSGAFWWPARHNGQATPGEWLTGRVAALGRRPVRFHLSAGLQEWGLKAAVYRFRDALRAQGYEVAHHEYNGGHDYLCWREDLIHGLVSLLRGPFPGSVPAAAAPLLAEAAAGEKNACPAGTGRPDCPDADSA